MSRLNIDTCSLLVEVSTSVWTARKLDKSVTSEVNSNKRATKDAARVNKNLLAGRSELENITKHVTAFRTYLYNNTLPWSDSGLRLLPTSKFMEFSSAADQARDEFATLVEDFIVIYPSLITAQAMSLGDMFNAREYPDANDIARRFDFRINYFPVPSSGDFRIDVGNELQQELEEKLARLTEDRVNNAIDSYKAKFREHLERMVDRLQVDVIKGEAVARTFHDTLLNGALELCQLGREFNFTGDVGLATACDTLEKALVGVTTKDLRKDIPTRLEVQAQVKNLLTIFN